MQEPQIPSGPWDNGILEEKEYDAIVYGIQRRRLKCDDGCFFRILLWLLQPEIFVATNVYVKEHTFDSARKRIWHLCMACGVPPRGFVNRLAEFSGRHLRVSLRTISLVWEGEEKEFSDVHYFLPPARPLSQNEWDRYESATTPGRRIQQLIAF